MSERDVLIMIAEALLIDPAQIAPTTRKEDVDAWDSMGVMSIMAMLEDEFGISLSLEEGQEIEAVGDIIALLRQRGKLQ